MTFLVMLLWSLRVIIFPYLVEFGEEITIYVVATPSGEECGLFGDYVTITEQLVTLYLYTDCNYPYPNERPLTLRTTFTPTVEGYWCVSAVLYDRRHDTDCVMVVPEVHDLFLPIIQK